jgi:flavorubredoxin
MGCCLETDVLGGGPVHVHTSCYLVVGTRKTLLFDTTLPANWTILDQQLDEVLGKRPLDWIVPSHPEIPHGGNIGSLLRKYPNSVVIGDARDYHLFFPEVEGRSVTCPSGTYLDLGGGYEFTILDAPIKDAPNTVWGYESRTRVLFSADAFSLSHRPPLDADQELAIHKPGECSLLVSELGAPPSTDQAAFITKAALYWTRHVPFAPFMEAVQKRLLDYPSSMVAPAHGNVIDDMASIMPIIEEAHRLAYKEVLQADRTTM